LFRTSCKLVQEPKPWSNHNRKLEQQQLLRNRKLEQELLRNRKLVQELLRNRMLVLELRS
jgi:hypothetical protein